MGTYWKMFLGAALLAGACSAWAGDIYTCKGANGVNVYQNAPCATATKQLNHRAYSDDMARAPAQAAYATTASSPAAADESYSNITSAPRSHVVQQTYTPPGYKAGGIGSSAYQRGEVQGTRCVNARGQTYFTRGQCGVSTVATGMAPRNWQQDQVENMPAAVMTGPDEALNPLNGQMVNLTPVPAMVPTFRRSRDQGTAVTADDACAGARKAAAGRFDARADARVQELCRFGRSMYDQQRSGRP